MLAVAEYFGGKLAELPLEEWHASALAWASGWLSEDKGREPPKQKLLRAGHQDRHGTSV